MRYSLQQSFELYVYNDAIAFHYISKTVFQRRVESSFVRRLEFSYLILPHDNPQLWHCPEVLFDLVYRPETTQRLEWRQSNRQLGLVIRVLVNVGKLPMQLLRVLLLESNDIEYKRM